MTCESLAPQPKMRPAGRALAALFAVGVAMAAFVVGDDWRSRVAQGSPAVPRAAAPAFIAEADPLFDGFPAEWPEQLAAGTGMFQCWPVGPRNPEESVVVWTDQAHQVVAFGAAREGMPLPGYAAALATAAPQAGQSVHVAGPGSVLRLSGATATLPMATGFLACERTWDD